MTLPGAPDTTGQTRRHGFAFGVAAFLVTTVLLWAIACPDPFRGCGQADPTLVIVVAAFVEILVAILCFAPAGRRFVVGFVTAFLVCAVSTCGVMTHPWLTPVGATVSAAQPLWMPVVKQRERSAEKESWIGVHRTQHPAVVHAARLVNALHECAERHRSEDAGASYPRTSAELLSSGECGELAQQALGSTNAPTRFTEGDNGWRWSYTASLPDDSGHASGYSVLVVEDPILDRAAPSFSGDEHGVVHETKPGAPGLFVASPVASLVMLRRCLTRVPAYRDSLAAARGWRASTPPLALVDYVCPELSRHISVDLDSPNRERGTLAVPVEDRAGEMVDTAAVYTTDFLAADPDGISFDLRATPRGNRNAAIHSGTRRFLVASDGTIHVRTAARSDSVAATVDDPIAPECLPGGGVDCGIVVQAAPSPVHGP
ncbi:MAG: hypothetical protein ACJ79K_06895 [Gemmatimonadaceae bacterium]